MTLNLTPTCPNDGAPLTRTTMTKQFSKREQRIAVRCDECRQQWLVMVHLSLLGADEAAKKKMAERQAARRKQEASA